MHGIHVWRASLVRPAAEVAALHDILDAAERSRAGKFHHERDQRRFVVARATLRTLLGELTATAPRAVPLCVLPGGKPALGGENAIDGLHFNVSHCGDLALFVFADREVGIDVERVAPHGDMGRVAAHFFSADEKAAFERLAQAERARFFFRTWVRKEAYVKATGTGLALDPAKVSVAEGYSVHDLDDIGDYVAAVAFRTANSGLPAAGSPSLVHLVAELGRIRGNDCELRVRADANRLATDPDSQRIRRTAGDGYRPCRGLGTRDP